MLTDDVQKEEKNPKDTSETISWIDFFQEHPPGKVIKILMKGFIGAMGQDSHIIIPEIQLYCPNETCNGYMFFSSSDSNPYISVKEWHFYYLDFFCRNCQGYQKTYSIALKREDSFTCSAYKFGENPAFGPPVPPRVLRLIQPDRELFLQGRRCENQGLGIGAFTYYRRVVENQWSRLIDNIIKVSRAIKAPEETVETLEAAKSENQFSKSVGEVKKAIPPSLLINGHNPLKLLHFALSQGVHNLPDDKCLSLATSIRVILFEFSEKLGQALKDEKELKDAVSNLLKVHEMKNEGRS